jgi:hypothetical protein
LQTILLIYFANAMSLITKMEKYVNQNLRPTFHERTVS